MTFDAVERLPVHTVPIGSLLDGNSPRSSGPNRQHVRALSQAEDPLPPILVHRPTMRVIDGAHRMAAARLRGDEEIRARLFDGPEEAAFVIAVHANTTHGLPLSLADRTVAAVRILALHPEWSDRAIARTAGLSASTVGSLRQRATVGSEQSNTRLGRDGRRRPVNAALARRRAARFIRDHPDSSLRGIADAAGTSTATARDVRQRLSAGIDPVPPRLQRAEQKAKVSATTARDRPGRTRPDRAADRPPEVIVPLLRRDPALRSTETGRALLRSFTSHIRYAGASSAHVDRLPPHSLLLALEAARGLAQLWNRFADELEERALGHGETDAVRTENPAANLPELRTP